MTSWNCSRFLHRPLLSVFVYRKSSGQRAALHQAEGEVHRAGPGSRRPAEKGETCLFILKTVLKSFLRLLIFSLLIIPVYFLCMSASVSRAVFHVFMCEQNAEVTRQMTVAREAQDEVDAVRREMQEKVKAAQEFADRQVSGWHGL